MPYWHQCLLLFCMPAQLLSHVWLFLTLRTVAHQAPLSMGFSRQESWSGLHALLQGIFLTQGSNPCVLCLPALTSRFFTTSAACEALAPLLILSKYIYLWIRVSRVVLVIKNSPANEGDARESGSIPGLGRSPEGGNGNPLQYSCLKNSKDREA